MKKRKSEKQPSKIYRKHGQPTADSSSDESDEGRKGKIKNDQDLEKWVEKVVHKTVNKMEPRSSEIGGTQ